MRKKLLIFILSLFVVMTIGYNQKALSKEDQPTAYALKCQHVKVDSSNRKTVMVNGLLRSYYIFLPPNYNPQKSYPVLFLFHGGFGNANSILKITGLRNYQAQYDFILIVPNGLGRFNFLTWNAGHCAGYALNSHANEPRFINSIIEKTAKCYNIDRQRIYLTGMSNGAMLCYKIAGTLSGKIAGIAPVVGSMNYNPAIYKKPIPVIIFNGTADRHVLYKGGIPLDFFEEKTRFDEPVSHAVDYWVKNNKCNAMPITTIDHNITIDRYTNCEDNAEVVLYTIVGGKHAWPGGKRDLPFGDEPTKEINASKIILDAFINNNF